MNINEIKESLEKLDNPYYEGKMMLNVVEWLTELVAENERLNDLLNKSDALWKNGSYVNGVLEKQNLEYRDKFHRAVKDYADQLTINDELAEALRKMIEDTPQGTWKATTGEGHAECLRIAREVLRKYGLSE